jgi:hypothetical protein
MAPEQLDTEIFAVVAALPLIEPDDTTIRQTEREEFGARHFPRLQMTLKGSIEFHAAALHEQF